MTTKRKRQRRIRLDTWQQAAEEGFILFCYDCPRIWKTEAWAHAHLARHERHALGRVHLQAELEMGQRGAA